MTLKSSTPNGGDCDTYTSDSFEIQRYLPPGTSNARIAVMSERMGTTTRLRHGDDRTFVYLPNPSGKEFAIGPLASVNPDADGLCKAALTPADQDLPAVTRRTASFPKDGGVQQLPATKLKYEYQNFRFLNTARFPGTVFNTTLVVTEDTCTATYEVNGVFDPIFGPAACETNADCDPNANLDAGRIFGSGLSPDIKPVCGRDGVCISSVPFDDLVKLK